MEVGQDIYLEPQNNAARYNKDIKKCTVSKVGRKYFEVSEIRGRFFIDTLSHDAGDYSPEHQGYLSIEVLNDKIERSNLHMAIKKYLNTHSPVLSLIKLREIDAIIESD